jgi:hypothetical protein
MTDATVLSMADPQPVKGPALSATSDMPSGKSASPPLSESVNKPAATKVADAGKETPPADDAAPLAADETGQAEAEAAAAAEAEANRDKTPAWMKAEVTKERNRRREADERTARAEANAARALAALENITKAQENTKSADVTDPKPSREKFDNPDAYDAALIEWSARIATRSTEAEQKRIRAEELQAQRQQEQAAQDQKIREEYAKRREAFLDDNPDYAEVAEENNNLKYTMPMLHAIMEDEAGPALAYFLAKNTDEMDRISKFTPARQATELGRIAARLTAKPVSTPKPAPIKPLGSRATVTPAWDAQSHMEKRLAEERAKRVSAFGGRPN